MLEPEHHMRRAQISQAPMLRWMRCQLPQVIGNQSNCSLFLFQSAELSCWKCMRMTALTTMYIACTVFGTLKSLTYSYLIFA